MVMVSPEDVTALCCAEYSLAPMPQAISTNQLAKQAFKRGLHRLTKGNCI